MWSFHFIRPWLSAALKHRCRPPVPSCSICSRRWASQAQSDLFHFPAITPVSVSNLYLLLVEPLAPHSITSLFYSSTYVPLTRLSIKAANQANTRRHAKSRTQSCSGLCFRRTVFLRALPQRWTLGASFLDFFFNNVRKRRTTRRRLE